MLGFDKNAAYLLTIIGLGLALPLLLTLYAVIKTRMAKKRLERLRETDS